MDNNYYAKNIYLKSKIGKNGIYLDLEWSIDATNRINTKIYEKQMDLHLTLHQRSNSPSEQKISVLVSQIFRSIIINDQYKDHQTFFVEFMKRLQRRGYHPALLRKMLRSKNIPTYKNRLKYIENITNNRNKKRSIIIANTLLLMDPEKIWMGHEAVKEYQELAMKEMEPKQNEKAHIIYFKKTFNVIYMILYLNMQHSNMHDFFFWKLKALSRSANVESVQRCGTMCDCCSSIIDVIMQLFDGNFYILNDKIQMILHAIMSVVNDGNSVISTLKIAWMVTKETYENDNKNKNDYFDDLKLNQWNSGKQNERKMMKNWIIKTEIFDYKIHYLNNKNIFSGDILMQIHRFVIFMDIFSSQTLCRRHEE